jgi:hypothetical protein
MCSLQSPQRVESFPQDNFQQRLFCIAEKQQLAKLKLISAEIYFIGLLVANLNRSLTKFISRVQSDDYSMYSFVQQLQNNKVQSLNLGCNIFSSVSISLNTDNTSVNTESLVKLSEALKSNTSLTALELSGNRLVVSFHSHLMQATILALQEL